MDKKLWDVEKIIELMGECNFLDCSKYFNATDDYLFDSIYLYLVRYKETEKRNKYIENQLKKSRERNKILKDKMRKQKKELLNLVKETKEKVKDIMYTGGL